MKKILLILVLLSLFAVPNTVAQEDDLTEVFITDSYDWHSVELEGWATYKFYYYPWLIQVPQPYDYGRQESLRVLNITIEILGIFNWSLEQENITMEVELNHEKKELCLGQKDTWILGQIYDTSNLWHESDLIEFYEELDDYVHFKDVDWDFNWTLPRIFDVDFLITIFYEQTWTFWAWVCGGVVYDDPEDIVLRELQKPGTWIVIFLVVGGYTIYRKREYLIYGRK